MPAAPGHEKAGLNKLEDLVAPDFGDDRGKGHGKDKWDDHPGLAKEYRLDFKKEDWGSYLNAGEGHGTASSKNEDTGGQKADAGQKKIDDLGQSKDEIRQTKDEQKQAKKEAHELKKLEKAEAKAEKKANKHNNGNDQELEAAAASIAAATAAAGVAGREAFAGDPSVFVITPGSYMRDEVLALNLSRAGEVRAKALGFITGDISRIDREAITTLLTPGRQDAISALALLRKELPGEHFQLNRLYRLYLPMEGLDAQTGRTEPARSGIVGRCEGDRCYGRKAIQWKDDFAHCAKALRVGLIDTDIDLRHPAFEGQKITQRSFLPSGSQASPNWHGTGIAALLAGRAESGTPGLIPEASFYAASIFFNGENGHPMTSTVAVLRALDWMRASGARLVNMSFSGPQDNLVRERIADLASSGIVFVAAAGNEGPAAEPTYPAAYPEVIAVTAVAGNLRIYPSANRGPYIDLAAPGVRIWTAVPDAREGYRSGTSFAAPFATAVLALQPPERLGSPKVQLLDSLNTVALGESARNATYGRGLLQAPRECLNAGDAITSAIPLPGKTQR
jgi:hypothetical protein